MPPLPAPSFATQAWDSRRWIALGLIVCTLMVFWPITRWLLQEISDSQQIRQSFVLLGAATAIVIWQHLREWHLILAVSDRSIALLSAAYLCVLGAWWLNQPLFALPAFTLGLAGCLHVLVGAPAARFIRPLFSGFIACLAVILLFLYSTGRCGKWPSINAARILHGLGFAPQLAVVLQPAPKLLLSTGHNVFEVATECNGFGLITSGAVLVVLAAGIAGRRARVLFWLIPLAMAVGFAGNLLRILIICLMAPSFPRHYHALHETAGVLILWTGLGLVGWLAWRSPVSPVPAITVN